METKERDRLTSRVLEAVRHEPGVLKRDLPERVDLPYWRVHERLRILEARGFVASFRFGNLLRIFPIPADADASWAERMNRLVQRERSLAPPGFTLPGGGGRGNPVRRLILDHVAKVPGISKSELVRQSGVPWSTLSYHVGVLRHLSHLTTFKDGRECRLFPGALEDHSMARLALADGLLRRVALGIEAGVRPAALARHLGLTRRQVWRRIGRLRGVGVMEESEYRLSSVGRSLLPAEANQGGLMDAPASQRRGFG